VPAGACVEGVILHHLPDVTEKKSWEKISVKMIDLRNGKVTIYH